MIQLSIFPDSSGTRRYCLVAAAGIFMLGSVGTLSAQSPRTPATLSIDSTAPAVDPATLELSDEEKKIESELITEKKTESVAEKYRELLTRDALPIKPSERGDPMVVPFINDKVVLEQLMKRMEESLAANRNNEAMVFAKNIARQFSGTPEAERALIVVADLSSGTSGSTQVDGVAQTVELDKWVRSNTRAILFDSEDPLVLVGTETLRVGDSVPGYTNHVVEEIRNDSVVYRVSNEYQTRTFEIVVNSGI